MSKTIYPELNHAIVEFYEKLFSWENAIARNSGLSPQQNHTIEIVGAEGPLRMKPLARKLGVTMGTLTVMINRLEKEGYVQREKDPEDGRGFNIKLTPKGEEIHTEHHAYHLKLVEDMAQHLSADDMARFLSILTKINEAL